MSSEADSSDSEADSSQLASSEYEQLIREVSEKKKCLDSGPMQVDASTKKSSTLTKEEILEQTVDKQQALIQSLQKKLQNLNSKKENKKTGKKKYIYPCPITGCKYKGLNIKRHIKRNHGRANVSYQDNRARGSFSVGKRKCHICYKFYKKLHQHLQVSHKEIEKGSPRYRDLLRKGHKDYIKRKRQGKEDVQTETSEDSDNGCRKRRRREKPNDEYKPSQIQGEEEKMTNEDDQRMHGRVRKLVRKHEHKKERSECSSKQTDTEDDQYEPCDPKIYKNKRRSKDRKNGGKEDDEEGEEQEEQQAERWKIEPSKCAQRKSMMSGKVRRIVDGNKKEDYIQRRRQGKKEVQTETSDDSDNGCRKMLSESHRKRRRKEKHNNEYEPRRMPEEEERKDKDKGDQRVHRGVRKLVRKHYVEIFQDRHTMERRKCISKQTSNTEDDPHEPCQLRIQAGSERIDPQSQREETKIQKCKQRGKNKRLREHMKTGGKEDVDFEAISMEWIDGENDSTERLEKRNNESSKELKNRRQLEKQEDEKWIGDEERKEIDMNAENEVCTEIKPGAEERRKEEKRLWNEEIELDYEDVKVKDKDKEYMQKVPSSTKEDNMGVMEEEDQAELWKVKPSKCAPKKINMPETVARIIDGNRKKIDEMTKIKHRRNGSENEDDINNDKSSDLSGSIFSPSLFSEESESGGTSKDDYLCPSDEILEESNDTEGDTNNFGAQIWFEENSPQDTATTVMIKGFCKHLALPDGGRMDKNNIIQHCQRVLFLIKLLDPTQQDYMSLLKKADSIWTEFVMKNLEGKQSKTEKGSKSKIILLPKTLKSYLLSLEKFGVYVRKVEKNRETAEQFGKMAERMPHWRKSIRKEIRIEEDMRFDEDLEKMPSESDLKEVLSCKYTQNILQMTISGADGDNVFSQREAEQIRDYLITRLIIENMLRPGVVVNITVKKLMNAVFNEATQQYSTTVYRHKGTVKHGSTHPTMSKQLRDLLVIYIEHIRTLFVLDGICDDDERPLFVNNKGIAMDSSVAGQKMKGFGRKCGVKCVFTPTLLRKTSSTAASNLNKQDQELHAGLLEHAIETERRHYVRHQKKSRQADAAAVNQKRLGIHNILYLNEYHPLSETIQHPSNRQRESEDPTKGIESIQSVAEDPLKGNESRQKDSGDATNVNENSERGSGDATKGNENRQRDSGDATKGNENSQRDSGDATNGNENRQRDSGDATKGNENSQRDSEDATNGNGDIQRDSGDATKGNECRQRDSEDGTNGNEDIQKDSGDATKGNECRQRDSEDGTNGNENRQRYSGDATKGNECRQRDSEDATNGNGSRQRDSEDPTKGNESDRYIPPRETASKGRKATLDSNQLAAIKEGFSSFITSGCRPSPKEVVAHIKKDNIRPLQNIDTKAIQNRVTYEIKVLQKVTLPPAETTLPCDKVGEWLKDVSTEVASNADTYTTYSSNSTRFRWPFGDEQTIQKHFYSLIFKSSTRPLRKEIRAQMKEPASADFLEILSRDQSEKWKNKIVEKVRTEWGRKNK